MYVFLIMFMSGLMVFISLRKHLLIVLFSLEYLMITVFMVFFYYLMMEGSDFYYLLLFLVFSVCEGVLGLGILVNMIRSHGNDLLSSFYMW
uniref:NADH dehydrogenase subunit 4L n=1 Tax=Cavelerius yunnanensis TaxID=2969358 RepID=UPI00206386AD|nr:NADH dehydrogenase subunit 4L [Cavelerius yunnanensis]UPL65542.1 NADH dehydrogenase subunit 4L [Cavelerius excavatus]UUJ37747.1 NADH dehydrogenase subunit 4L [Cavelerius yunnanensis]